MHENFRICSYAHKIKHFFCIFEMRKLFRNFWNFLKFQRKTGIFNTISVSYNISLQSRY
jgi:hypothetical protein